MEKELPLIPQLHLRNIEIINNSPTKRTYRGPNSNRTLIKTYLTREILEECLQTLDIFKQIMEDPIQRNKLVRDVNKSIQLKLYDSEAILYNKGDVAQSIYMVIKGSVSLCLPVIKTKEGEGETIVEANQNEDIQYQYQEIDNFGEGVGFGEAEFIHKKKRGLVAKVSQNDTVVGIIVGSAFEEIIELYRQRVYYKKMDMFNKCPLLKNLQTNQMQFIVNNAKPIIFSISKEIVELGEKPKALYLITEGEVELRKEPAKEKSTLKHHCVRSKLSLEDARRNKIRIKNVVVGVLEQGQFLGDCELALDLEYNFTAVCKSQKVKAYICDERIIMSQMEEQSFEEAANYYTNKKNYRQNKMVIYRDVKSKIQRDIETNDIVVLNKNQLRIKRQIMNRYVEKIPTLIGQLSPRQIGKMVDIKFARIKTEPSRELDVNFPSINLMSPQKRLKRNSRAFSPLLKKSQQSSQKRKYSESEQSIHSRPIGNSVSYNRPEPIALAQNEYEYTRSQTRPLLVFMRPFHKKVESLHERLSKQYNNLQRQKQTELDRIQKITKDHQFSVMEMRRVCQFVNRIKHHNDKGRSTVIEG